MSLLGSYCFGTFLGKDEVPEKVLNLFSSSVQSGKEIRFASEIVFAGMQGNINLNKPFNLEAYEKAIESNSWLSKNKRKKKELYIDSSSGDDYEDTVRNGGIREDKLSIDSVEDAYEEVLDSDELKYAVSQIKKLNQELIAVEKVNTINAMKSALDGFPKAIAEIKRICDFYPSISEYIQVILSCGKSLDEVFAM